MLFYILGSAFGVVLGDLFLYGGYFFVDLLELLVQILYVGIHPSVLEVQLFEDLNKVLAVLDPCLLTDAVERLLDLQLFLSALFVLFFNRFVVLPFLVNNQLILSDLVF